MRLKRLRKIKVKNKQNNNLLLFITIHYGSIMNKYLLWTSMFILAACSDQNGDLVNWMTETSQQAKTRISKPKEAKLNLQPLYTPPPQPTLNMFDPAKLKVDMQGANAPNPNRPKEILENYPLDELRYVGLIKSTNKSPSAFIQVNGHVYTVTIGNYLGQNYGRITAITPDEIIISELLEDATGSWSDHPNNLPLQSQDQTESNS